MVVTDGFTGSTSLLFMDELLSVPGTVHVGSATGWDTRYGECEDFVPMPSGRAAIGIPAKMRRGDWKRTSGQRYVPLARHTACDDESVRAVVASALGGTAL